MRDVDGRRLTFHLAGINNQNFLMRDEETGSYWQQISGLAISGPLKGQQLTLMLSDELTFATWKAEEPKGTVLKQVAKYASEYEAKDWDVHMAGRATVIQFPEHGMQPRDLILGIQDSGASRAFLYDRVIKEKLVKEYVGPQAVLIVVGPDGQSLRAFRDRIPGVDGVPDFYRMTANKPGGPLSSALMPSGLMMDAATGSEWNFQGCAISGKAEPACLERIPMLKDYWFDWRNYHPQTAIWGNRTR
jgi:Protein of unknown function (DUF3179)